MNRFIIGGLSLLLASTIAVPAVKASEDQPEIHLNDVEQPVLTGADLVTHGASSSSIGGGPLTDAPDPEQVADSIQIDRSALSKFEMQPSPEAGPTEAHGNRSVSFPLE
ncbi:MAG: hypothetical protein QNJ46_29005 [Leptolyngbyaceae cyanobacterium MO_188.B28]|nr:hypothetical protein [Leptolyngbyaceae cyanobacterium MO_188.B28]